MKIRRKINIRIEIEPDITSYLYLDRDGEALEKLMIERSNELLASIRRHVDGSSNARICYDTESQCSFCGNSEEWGGLLPQCCDEAQIEFFVTILEDGSVRCTHCGHGVEGASYPVGTCDYCGPLMEKIL